MDFFIEESCGYCTPCRVGNVLLKQRLRRSWPGGRAADLEYLGGTGETVKTCSRCGLGQTSANPVLTTLKNFRAGVRGPGEDHRRACSRRSIFNGRRARKPRDHRSQVGP
jgi:NADH:ubiquinone oxidoreductase subunit F (NADH-binding)